MVVGGFLAGKVVLDPPARTEPVQTEPEKEYSGEIEETKGLLSKWNTEIGQDGKKLEKQAPHIVKLATKYFGKQMSSMFPEKASDYSYDRLKNRVSLVSGQELDNKLVDISCGMATKVPPDAEAVTDPSNAQINISPSKIARLNPKYRVTQYASGIFLTTLHELMHSSVTRTRHTPPVLLFGHNMPVDIEVGLDGFAINRGLSARYKKECLMSSQSLPPIEELVVEDAAMELASLVGAENQNSRLIYENSKYREKIRSLFGGDYKELLRYQQFSNIEGYLVAVGSKLGGVNRQDQMARAGQHIKNIFK